MNKQFVAKNVVGEKIGKYAKRIFTYLLENNLLTPSLIFLLQDKAYCSKTFGLSYPVLVDAKTSNTYLYYCYRVIIKGYGICQQWKERNRRIF